MQAALTMWRGRWVCFACCPMMFSMSFDRLIGDHVTEFKVVWAFWSLNFLTGFTGDVFTAHYDYFEKLTTGSPLLWVSWQTGTHRLQEGGQQEVFSTSLSCYQVFLQLIVHFSQVSRGLVCSRCGRVPLGRTQKYVSYDNHHYNHHCVELGSFCLIEVWTFDNHPRRP